VRIFYRLEGDDERPVLALSHSLGADHGMWEPQMPDLLRHFRVLRYDSRGHGASDAPPGEYTIERLARDLLGLADALGIRAFGLAGLSLGGMVGQWLAIHAPERLTRLVLANTSPCTGTAIPWDTRRQIVLEQGLAAIVDATMERWFLPATRARRDPYFRSMRRVFLGTDAKGYAACCSAIRDMDFTASLGTIRTPTLVIAGDVDIATPIAGHGDLLAREIPGARLTVFHAAHISNVDRPRSFNAAMLGFLVPERVAEPLEAGYAARRAALGDEYVDRSIAKTTEFTRDFQEMITRWAWGAVWARPQMDRRTRRLVVLAILAALGRWDEFRLHVRSGLARELEPCDLKEALLAVGAYAGSPAANKAFSIAEEEMRSEAPGEGEA